MVPLNPLKFDKQVRRPVWRSIPSSQWISCFVNESMAKCDPGLVRNHDTHRDNSTFCCGQRFPSINYQFRLLIHFLSLVHFSLVRDRNTPWAGCQSFISLLQPHAWGKFRVFDHGKNIGTMHYSIPARDRSPGASCCKAATLPTDAWSLQFKILKENMSITWKPGDHQNPKWWSNKLSIHTSNWRNRRQCIIKRKMNKLNYYKTVKLFDIKPVIIFFTTS